jgi:hypothetical protein
VRGGTASPRRPRPLARITGCRVLCQAVSVPASLGGLPHGQWRRSRPSSSSRSKAYRKASRDPLRPKAANSMSKSDTPSWPHTTPSPSMVTEVTRSAAMASAISGTRSVQSRPLRENTRTRSRSRRQMKRNPSCLISYAHCGPAGTVWPLVGKQGSMKPGRRRAGAELRQCLGLNTRRTSVMRIDTWSTQLFHRQS